MYVCETWRMKVEHVVKLGSWFYFRPGYIYEIKFLHAKGILFYTRNHSLRLSSLLVLVKKLEF